MMSTRCIRKLLAGITGAAALSLTGAAPAQDFPSKAIRLIVANSPGTTLDAVARFLAPELSQALNQTVIVENKPGATFIIGYEFVAKSPPDGYTIGVVIMQDLGILPLISKELRFDPIKELPAFLSLGEGRLALATSTKNPWKTYEEMMAFAKANPGKLNFGSSGAQVRLPMESLVSRLGLNVVHVPYPGGNPMFLALAANDVQMGFVGEGTLVTLGDKVRALGVTGDQRLTSLPGVPTFQQLGQPQIRGLTMSLNLPAGVPKAVVDKLYQTTAAIMQRPDIRERFAKVRYEVNVLNADGAARKLAEEAKLFSEIAAAAGIKPQ